MPEIVTYDLDWPCQVAAAVAELVAVAQFDAIEHIGSTAVPGMAAKPTIDLMAVGDVTRPPAVEILGYQQHFNGMTDRLLYFRFQDGRRTHILHVVSVESWPTRNQRILRDYLRQHPDDADRYSRLKYELAGSPDYTRAKTGLIQELTSGLVPLD